ncbi:MAG: uracil-DNA glycosylase [Fimbriimonadaceae bacterium]|nr:uracil-DNA glycosylase [Fimbriimonadaceae bacterium]QYK58362.1 MAG: uracil-DNA glycosylase [Fimbriimonadaceae bacterium]
MSDAVRLEALRAEALGCESCVLSSRRTHVVFGEGNPKAPLVLVGEGPGEEEDKTGRPFVGRAGKLLDSALGDCGLTRDDVYICNTVKCRACDWSTGRPVNRPPTDEEAAACRQWLFPQLAAIAPEAILCIGAPSAKNLIKRDFKITRERGRFFPTELCRVILATLHPAYILRQQGATSDGGYSMLVADIARGWETAVKLRARGSTRAGVEVAPAQLGLEL